MTDKPIPEGDTPETDAFYGECGNKYGNDGSRLLAALDLARSLERRSILALRQNVTFRNAQKACEDCDAITMEEVRALRATLAEKGKP